MSKHPFIKIEFENISFLLDKDNFTSENNINNTQDQCINLQEILNTLFNIHNNSNDTMNLYYTAMYTNYVLNIQTIVSVDKVELRKIKPFPKILRHKFLTKGILGMNIDDNNHPIYLLDLENLLKGYI